MGRSQVERNRIKGRPGGRGGRGRGGGSGNSGAGGRGGGGGRSSSNKRRSGPDPRTLGDNAFRFERRNKDDTSNDDDDDYGSSDMLLDDFNTGLLLGSDYYGASHYDLQEDDYNEGETTITSFENSSDNDWMSVDVQALTACLKQLPIHERLDVPYHVGKHIESRYGIDNAAAGGKKTLAELREESKCIVNNDDDYGINNSADDLPTVEELDTNTNQNSLETEEAKAGNNSDGDEDDEDDLDAWLDDMIS
eukprot:CAMPEP_0113421580 /NCGR_PEP_ID=MMETSP0013_2-20120614/27976_1 /TAXON_ID=2843 ORGANISM="Skeletonema costatum, Strain 1716" /NCGR_SAMPLE_ID=MMETSP0013_2 /ASSEMBLY_ACC=CAM_ASM_000158 /LENGTH=249 /DNA_ID=CAMNT_0000309213 /DNA_START=21 /DNA_END=770 /DNA_ORIENTATION=+ /assembly_acc=CAM_ASM_000158